MTWSCSTTRKHRAWCMVYVGLFRKGLNVWWHLTWRKLVSNMFFGPNPQAVFLVPFSAQLLKSAICGSCQEDAGPNNSRWRLSTTTSRSQAGLGPVLMLEHLFCLKAPERSCKATCDHRTAGKQNQNPRFCLWSLSTEFCNTIGAIYSTRKPKNTAFLLWCKTLLRKRLRYFRILNKIPMFLHWMN